MADKPIIFSAPMIRALLASRKTQTRRVISFPGIENVLDFVKVGIDKDGRNVYEMKGASGQHVTRPAGKGIADYQYSPRIAVGDRLYVRETWAPISALKHNDPGVTALAENGFYRADDSVFDDEITRWTPAIHQPHKASRLTLIVSNVRIERLQDISDDDVIAEGIQRLDGLLVHYGRIADAPYATSAKGAYAILWDSINKPGAWAANPWVAAYTFSVIRQNIDLIQAPQPDASP
ncbi:hypothetical protein [Agrobacterium vitis]|uniref:hypothetical protein n=1 Tax=Agrobacterium vitis TaxID=373 RepID=UPI0012E90E3F|nr:hypothetical protein [Agrobacterium vitis]MUZ65305.1 hypothetical protein [Agrobacterium vitis]